MIKKLKKAIPAVISALLCMTIALGVTASAANTDIWKDTKALTSMKYNSKYIKWAEKYSEKETKNTVAYSKSRTKKFLDRLQKEANAENPEYIFGLIDSDSMMCYVFAENSFKGVSLIDGECNILYLNDNAMTVISTVKKTKASLKLDKDETEEFNEITSEYADEYSDDVAETFGFDIAENAKGKIFKFRSDEKIYYYEEFDTDSYYGNIGMVFTEKGTPIALYINDIAFCVTFKTKVDDSEFDIPKGYKTIDFDDFEY